MGLVPPRGGAFVGSRSRVGNGQVEVAVTVADHLEVAEGEMGGIVVGVSLCAGWEAVVCLHGPAACGRGAAPGCPTELGG